MTNVTDPSGTAAYTWNARNQLTGISMTGFAASFACDAVGRRSGKTIQGVVTNYVYDGLNPMQEKNGSTVTANLLTGLGIDEFFTRTDGGGTKALLAEGLGSTVALDDGTGSLPTQYTYEPFGYTTQAGQASTNSYKYTGREDDGTGLYYYRARYYHPRLQRFVSEDPLGFYVGPNFYAYVDNKVFRYTDPLGLDKTKNKWDVGFGATWGSDGAQCTFSGGCSSTTTFPPELQVDFIQVSYNKPPESLNPREWKVNIYEFVTWGVEIDIGTYSYDNPNMGPGTQTTLQQGFTFSMGFGAGSPISVQR